MIMGVEMDDFDDENVHFGTHIVSRVSKWTIIAPKLSILAPNQSYFIPSDDASRRSRRLEFITETETDEFRADEFRTDNTVKDDLWDVY